MTPRLTAITSHIPDKGSQHNGHYSNKSRGLRRKVKENSNGEIIIAQSPTKKSCSKKWVYYTP
jgi:hypothetical protein